MAARLIKPNEAKIWLSKAEVWPIIVCITGACAWTAYMGGRYLLASPNTTSISSRQERAAAQIKDNEARAVAWRRANAYHVAQDAGDIRIFGSFPKKDATTVGRNLNHLN